MKAFQVTAGFGIDRLEFVDRPEPEPGPGQVLIKLRAASLNYRDLMVVKGQYNPKMALPRIPGSDGAGDIVSIGAGVTRVKPGDRVVAIFMPEWLSGQVTPEQARSALGGAVDGLFAEYAVLSQEAVLPIPEHLSYEEAASLPCAAVTAWNALFATGNLKAGDSLLVQGTGGVSIFALQFGTIAGARVIATSSSDAKLSRAREMGASDGINYVNTPKWDKAVRDLTNGAGVDQVVEVGGSGTLNQSLGAVRLGGTVSVIGALSGGSGPITTVSILMKAIRVQGIFVGSREMFEAMNRAISLHRIKPVIDRVFPFPEAREALTYMESGAHFGKICLSF